MKESTRNRKKAILGFKEACGRGGSVCIGDQMDCRPDVSLIFILFYLSPLPPKGIHGKNYGTR